MAWSKSRWCLVGAFVLLTATAAPTAASGQADTSGGSGGADSSGFVPYFTVGLQASPVYGQVVRPGFLLSPIVATNLLEAAVSLDSSGDENGSGSIVDPGPIGGFPALLPLAEGNTLPAVPWPGWPLTASSSYPANPVQTIGLGGVPSGFPAGSCSAASGSQAQAGLLFAGAVSTQNSACGSAYLATVSSAGKLISLGSATATSSATSDPSGAVTGVATSTLDNLDVGGFLHIGSVVSTTTVTASPSGATSDSSMSLAGVTVLGGWQATIDRDGVHVVGLPGGAVPTLLSLQQAQSALDTALKSSGLTVRLLGATHASAPGDATTPARSEASALEISYPVTLPVSFPNIPNVPVAIPLGNGIPTIVTLKLGYSSGSAVAGGSSLGGNGSLGTVAPTTGSNGGLSVPASASPVAPSPASSSLSSPPATVAQVSAPPAAPTVPVQPTTQASSVPAARTAASPALAASIRGAFGWVLALGVLAAVLVVAQIRLRARGLASLLRTREVQR